MVEHLPSKGKVLGSNPIASGKKKLKKKKNKQPLPPHIWGHDTISSDFRGWYHINVICGHKAISRSKCLRDSGS
jgi:hypothetical protein